MSSRKRLISDDGGGDYGGGGGDRLRGHRSSRRRTTTGGAGKSETELWLTAQRRGGTMLLNEKYHAGLADLRRQDDAADPDDDGTEATMNLTNEYLRNASEIRHRFGCETGMVVGFGSNETSSLGLIENIGKDHEDNFFPPRFVRALSSKGMKIRRVTCGGTHSAALSCDGTVYTFGVSDDGTLGRFIPTGENVDMEVIEANPAAVTGFRAGGVVEDGKIVDVVAGIGHILFLSKSGRVYHCGMYKDGDSGKFSHPEDPGSKPLGVNKFPVHVPMPGNAPVARIITGSDSAFNAVLLRDGTLLTFGFGNCGELGRSADMVDPDPNYPDNYDVSRDSYVSAVDDEKKLNWDLIRKFLAPSPVRFAKLGPHNSSPRCKKIVLSVACGESHLLVAARDPGAFHSYAYSCGLNCYGQLGNGHTVSAGDFKKDKSLPLMVHALTKIKSLEKENITQVAAGAKHSLALTHDGKILYAWGKADEGQLGIGYNKSQEKEAWPDPQIVEFPRPNGEVRPIIKSFIGAGQMHSVVITIDGELYTWGAGDTNFTAGHPTEVDRHVYRPKKLDLLGVASSALGGSFKSVETVQAACGSMSTLLIVQPKT